MMKPARAARSGKGRTDGRFCFAKRAWLTLVALGIFTVDWSSGPTVRAEDAPPTVQKLIELLNSQEVQVRRDAAEDLGRRGGAARE